MENLLNCLISDSITTILDENTIIKKTCIKHKITTIVKPMGSFHLKNTLLQDIKRDLIDTLRQPGPMDPINTGIDPAVNTKIQIQAVLFDVYGTLFVSGSGDVGSAQKGAKRKLFYTSFEKSGCTILSETGIEEAPELFIELIKKSHNQSKSNGIQYPEVDILRIWESLLISLLKRKIIQVPDDPYLLFRLATLYESLSNPVYPMPGSLDIIEFSRRSNIPFGIVSNAQFFTPLLFEAYFDRNLQTLGFNDKMCFWSYDHMRAKPDRTMFRFALDVLNSDYGIQPHNILYIGNDMLNDIAPAFSEGCRTCLFAGDSRSLRLRREIESIKFIKPDIIITDLHQLIPILS
jgi:putative hydrolase of the HAD superfamily